MSRYDKKSVKHLNPENIVFCVFSPEEVKKLSVLKICTPLTFDILGHPLTGGLYDKRLGPVSDRSDPCGTCGKNLYFCPGHFGHIELPVNVVNPLFHNLIATILKKSCFICYQIQIPVHLQYLLSIQMKLLDHGFLAEANEIEYRIVELTTKFDTFDNIPEEEMAPIKEYETILIGASKIETNKNIMALREKFISNISSHLGPRKTCLFCKGALVKISLLKNTILYSAKIKNDNETINYDDTTSSALTVKQTVTKHLNPDESRKIIRNVFDNNKEFMFNYVPVLKEVKMENPTDIFYLDYILVPPPNVRPVNMVNGLMSEHQQSLVYKTILQDSMLLRTIMQVVINDGNIEALPIEAQATYRLERGNSALEKFNNVWDRLQNDVNFIVDYDSKLSTGSVQMQGLKQIIEKKQGVIRMHMMGKRVNFAARSVITPDPNLNIDEIGIPEEFAKHLTYPVPVTAWNVEELRKLITNGPDVHPGAVSVEFEDGTVNRINPKNTTQQESLLKRLLTPDGPDKSFKGVKMVNRHLCNGDILLLNRQPTLHRPSIMAHTARVLKGEKTLRLHYANCKAYNADFDGDEMNAHFPQNELARSEGYILANVSNHYLVPKDGTPLSGLIQDHMISGVRMTIRGKFFNKVDYQQLVYQALSHKLSNIKLLEPAILKPQKLWSGKQIISTVIMNIIPTDKKPINLTATSKIPSKAWQNFPARKWNAGGEEFSDPNTMTEAEVIIRQGELLVGILDKTHYGATPYGLVHCMYELYGGTQAIKLLSSLAKLFTWFLQCEGFTLGVKDILVLKDADVTRSKIVKDSRKLGKKAITEALNLPIETEEEAIVSKIQEQTASNPKIRNIIDRQYKSVLDSYTNDINKVCLPAGLICKFPENNLQLMVQSGAKGSTVNTMQISCLLGQIELEGKRPPIMISGKSLPSFPAHEFAPRAGGFIDGRFMTGIQPQEFFFHCMAGREGLIDTAVKTSRSGYLQRCLVKHLEGLKVGYDLTVRDSDMSVIQFNYGEDGMDISKAQFLNKKQFPFLSENCEALGDKNVIKDLKSSDSYSKMLEHEEIVHDWFENRGETMNCIKRTFPYTIFSSRVHDKIDLKNGDEIIENSGRSKRTKLITQLWQQSKDDIKKSFQALTQPCPDPVVSKFRPDFYYGAINERLSSLIDDYSSLIKKKKDKKLFSKMVKLKAMESLCAPGEPVGLLAAQSIGEPSTQMTLNTFHFAGRGEMNVTLGIPRLREILMMASKNIKTPSMEVPFLNVDNLEAKAEKLRKQLTRVVVADILEKVDVTQELELATERRYMYTVKFQFIPYKLYKRDYYIKPKNVIKHMGAKFFQLLFLTIKKYGKGQKNVVIVETEKSPIGRKKGAEDDEEDFNENANAAGFQDDHSDSSDDELPDDSEDAKANTKYTAMHDDQEPEDEEVEIDPEDQDNVEENAAEEKAKREDMLVCSEVVSKHEYAEDFSFDVDNYSWCQITFGIPLTLNKIDLTAILKEVANKAVLWETPGIKRAITYMNNDKLTIRTDGINFLEMFKHSTLLDLNKLFSNDIHRVAQTYGIEAARRVIVKEVQDVFKVYGITVDPRHLLLIADYMTFGGQFEPLNRSGMESSTSPFQQMTFEASLKFLKSAAIKGKEDKLENPSSCLIVGKPCTTGTGSFTLLQQINVA